MARLRDLDDVDLTPIALDDGTPLLAAWRPGPDGTGVWVAEGSLPASAVRVDIPPTGNRLMPRGFLPPTIGLQDLVTSFYRDGFNVLRAVTDDDPDVPTQARSFLLTDYRRHLGWDQLGGSGSLFGLTYGRPDDPAGGFVNVTTILAEVEGSEDPANEIGGTIASLQLGRGSAPPPTATLWGSSYTLRGSVDRQPGALMAYTAVVQNYFDGPGSRSPNYGYAAVTRPGIGDGADWHDHDDIRNATTYPVDLGFVVCGDSGPFPDGGDVGYRVAFQAGGAASPWSFDWRTKIGTGLLVRDWVDAGVHVQAPHPDAGTVPQLRLDRRDGQEGHYLECRSEDGLGLMLSIDAEGRVRAADGVDPSHLVTKGQLDAEVAALREELRAEIRAAVSAAAAVATPAAVPTTAPGDALGTATTGALGRELARRLSPRRGSVWRPARHAVRRVRSGRPGGRGSDPAASG